MKTILDISISSQAMVPIRILQPVVPCAWAILENTVLACRSPTDPAAGGVRGAGKEEGGGADCHVVEVDTDNQTTGLAPQYSLLPIGFPQANKLSAPPLGSAVLGIEVMMTVAASRVQSTPSWGKG